VKEPDCERPATTTTIAIAGPLSPHTPPLSAHPPAPRAPKDPWRQPAAPRGADMTSRLRGLWITLAATTATAAVFTTPAILAGITFRNLD